MDDLCSIELAEQAQFCCICKFPLPLLCEEHRNEHESKPGFHFILPLRAKTDIPTREISIQVREWVTLLSHRFETLRLRVTEFSKIEEKIDAVHDELSQQVKDTRARLYEEFSVAKTELNTAVENAIHEISTHAWETQTFIPKDSFSQLLWYYDTPNIAAYEFYTFQANSVKESLDSAFQVALCFTMPGFEHLNVGHSTQMSGQSFPERTNAPESEVETLRKVLREAEIANHKSESAIQELKRQLQEVDEQLKELHRDSGVKELRRSALQTENTNLTALVKAKTDEFSQLEIDLARTQKELEATKSLCMDKDLHISALEKEVTNMKNLIKDRDNQIAVSNNKTATTEEGVTSEDLHPMQLEERKFPAEPVQPLRKLIAVREYDVQCFDIPSSQWQKLFQLRQTSTWYRVFQQNMTIQVDYSTSSTFTTLNRIVACGGGASVDNACTCHLDSNAYMLGEDGSVEELPQMSTGRMYPGLAWDSDREALYVFAGVDGTYGTCYTASLLSSEMFLSNQWSPLAPMHQGRSSFNPCWHSCLVYLCGGCTDSVETYDPRSNTFTLQDFTLPESGQAIAVVEDGILTIISRGHISKLKQGRLSSQQHESYGPWSNCTPVVSGGVVYLVRLGDNCCRGVDLKNGAKCLEVSSR